MFHIEIMTQNGWERYQSCHLISSAYRRLYYFNSRRYHCRLIEEVFDPESDDNETLATIIFGQYCDDPIVPIGSNKTDRTDWIKDGF